MAGHAADSELVIWAQIHFYPGIAAVTLTILAELNMHGKCTMSHLFCFFFP